MVCGPCHAIGLLPVLTDSSSWPVRFTTWFSPGFGRILSHRIACQSARFKKGEPQAHPFFISRRLVFVLDDRLSQGNCKRVEVITRRGKWPGRSASYSQSTGEILGTIYERSVLERSRYAF